MYNVNVYSAENNNLQHPNSYQSFLQSHLFNFADLVEF